VRVIAGQARGRPLVATLSRGRGNTGSDRRSAAFATWLRPTADKVREAVFDSLGSLLAAAGLAEPGHLDGLEVVDLFAGSGALGIEALSRGAISAVFVDERPEAVAIVRRNLAATGLEAATAKVVRAEVLGWSLSMSPVTVAFCDPPYAFDDDRWRVLLDRLAGRVVVAESDREIPASGTFEVVRVKRYGSTLVTMLAEGSIARAVGGADPDPTDSEDAAP
jgi:16S rRNA (guanine966-N2)-methyltransferase